jgi:hypothetical protein
MSAWSDARCWGNAKEKTAVTIICTLVSNTIIFINLCSARFATGPYSPVLTVSKNEGTVYLVNFSDQDVPS